MATRGDQMAYILLMSESSVGLSVGLCSLHSLEDSGPFHLMGIPSSRALGSSSFNKLMKKEREG